MESHHSRQVRISIERINGKQRSKRKDRVAVEEPLLIRLTHPSIETTTDLSVTMRTPKNDFELVAGFLYAENIIQSKRDIECITHCLRDSEQQQQYNIVRVDLAPHVDPKWLSNRYFIMHSGCGVCGQTSIASVQAMPCPTLRPHEPKVTIETLHQLVAELQKHQTIFMQTGGLHAAALFDSKGNLLSVREDIGRHNAVDKLIGQQLFADTLPLQENILLVSSRMSFELVQKAIRAGIPIIASIGAPSSLAVELAQTYGMSLLGFLREERCNLYADDGRIR